MHKKKVLCFGRKMVRGGGVENYIYSLFCNIDKESIQMDFLIPYSMREGQAYLDQIESQGGKVFLIPSHKENLIQHIINTYKLSKKYRRDGLIHIHVSDGFHAIDGIIARIAGIKNIVFHSHNASFIKSKGKKTARFLFRISGTYFLGCTKDAGIYMFGKNIINSNKFKVAKNGIDTNKFRFDKYKRKKIREEFNISDDIKLIGFVGRFSSEKNILFVIESFNELLKLDKDYMLLLVGDGEDKEIIKNKINELGIQGNVIFTGVRDDIDFIMSGLDLLLLPSHYESLGIVLIEAQASGLPCLVSNGVTKYAKITDLIHYLDFSSKEWGEKIYYYNFDYDRYKYSNYVKNAGYDIEDTTKDIEEFYIKLLNTSKY